MINTSPISKSNINGQLMGIELYVSALRRELGKERQCITYLTEKLEAMKGNISSMEGQVEWEKSNET